MSALQQHAADWHRRRWPHSEPDHVTLDAVARLGALADLVLIERGIHAHDDPEIADIVPDTAGDILVILLALIGRWWPSYDLIEEVTTRIEVLATLLDGDPEPGAPVTPPPPVAPGGGS